MSDDAIPQFTKLSNMTLEQAREGAAEAHDVAAFGAIMYRPRFHCVVPDAQLEQQANSLLLQMAAEYSAAGLYGDDTEAHARRRAALGPI